ncbi:MAG TPA: hypothetical protein VM870_08195, partial [Pyrinomonadaceae bacterium]|nr:hypothetical protein [Pyrinomonadaceae bacterium]
MDEQIREGVGPAERIAAPRAAESMSVAGGERVWRPRGEGGAGRWFHPLVELTKSRVREFLREPEVVFWVFVFPVLLACALGIAFRNTEPEKVRIGVETANAAGADALVRAFANSPDVEAVALSPEEAAQGLRGGRLALVIKSAESGAAAAGPSAYTYRYDPTRPESRAARLAVDDALQRSLGRQDVTA